MPCTPELVDELNMLIRFDLVTDQQLPGTTSRRS
jgi:hypothetical protein